jgi:hypothetical protein
MRDPRLAFTEKLDAAVSRPPIDDYELLSRIVLCGDAVDATLKGGAIVEQSDNYADERLIGSSLPEASRQ